MKLEKIVLMGISFSILYEIVREFLIVLRVVKVHNIAALSGLIFLIFGIIMLGILVKHKYWVIGSIFLFFNAVAKSIATKSYRVQGDVTLDGTTLDVSSAIIMIIAILCLIISLFYFYKLLRLKEFSIKKHYRFKKK